MLNTGNGIVLPISKSSHGWIEIVDPEGGAQDVRRFSMRQDASSKNPGHISVGRFASALSVFFGYFLCAKESNSRTQREKVPSLTRTT